MVHPSHDTRPAPLRAAAAGVGALLWSLLLVLVLRYPPDGHDHGNLPQFVGRLHPLLVHGPVALLLLVPLMELAGRKASRLHLRSAAGWILAVAAIAALAAAFDGWLLAWSGGYRGRDVTRHLWGGVTLAAVCGVAVWSRVGRGGPAHFAYPFLLGITVAVMVWTADGGGAISHGDGFLTAKMPARMRAWLGIAAPAPAVDATPAIGTAAAPARAGPGSADPANPAYFGVHIAPLLARSCVSCHKAEKHKGGLRLDTLVQLMRGGEDGPVVVPGNPKGSELLRRVRLPASDDDSMPSDGDKPLAPEEISMIEHWIAAGAPGPR
jgi:uncharacterized membrane protein